MSLYGRNDLENIAKMLSKKTLRDVTNYHHVFWTRGQYDIANFDRMIAPIVAKETAKNEKKELKAAFRWICSKYEHPEYQLTAPIKHRNSHYTQCHDDFFLRSLHRFGVYTTDVCARIQKEIRYDLLFLFFYLI